MSEPTPDEPIVAESKGLSALRFIEKYISTNGYPPSRREVAEHLECSVAYSQTVVDRLVEEGLVRTVRNSPRTTTIPEAGFTALTEEF